MLPLKYSELPAIDVSRSAMLPPVQLSAVDTVNFLFFSNSPMMTSNGVSSSLKMSSPNIVSNFAFSRFRRVSTSFLSCPRPVNLIRIIPSLGRYASLMQSGKATSQASNFSANTDSG